MKPHQTPERARRTLFLCFLPIAVLLGACNGDTRRPLAPEEATARDAVVERLAAVDTSAMASAFRRLPDYEYERRVRTEQYDGSGALVAHVEHVVRAHFVDDRRRIEVARTDSGGAFDFGLFDRFVSDLIEGDDPVDLADYVLPEDPPYLNARTMDDFRYEALEDTLLHGMSVDRYEVSARPGSGSGPAMRRAAYTLEQRGDRLVGLSIERSDRALLFRQRTRFEVELAPVDSTGSVMVPRRTEFDVEIRSPFRDPYRIRSVSTYSGFAGRD